MSQTVWSTSELVVDGITDTKHDENKNISYSLTEQNIVFTYLHVQYYTIQWNSVARHTTYRNITKQYILEVPINAQAHNRQVSIET